MTSLNVLFTPFSTVPRRWVQILVVAQATMALLLWSFAGSKSLPSPMEVGISWVDLAQNKGMLYELWSSVKISLLALLLSSVTAIAVAALSTSDFFKPFAKLWSSLRFLGFAGLTYIFMLISSDGYVLRLWLLSFGMFVFLVTGLLAEIEEMKEQHPGKIDHCRTLGMSGWRITLELVLLSKADATMDLIRQNAAIGWTLLTLVEGLTRSEGGIGAMLLNQNRYFLLAGVFAIQITILVFGLAQDTFLAFLKNTLCPYTLRGTSVHKRATR